VPQPTSRGSDKACGTTREGRKRVAVSNPGKSGIRAAAAIAPRPRRQAASACKLASRRENAHEVNQPLAALVANVGAALRWLAGDPPRIDKARHAMTRIARDVEVHGGQIWAVPNEASGTAFQFWLPFGGTRAE
jgi:hypothetical protein